MRILAIETATEACSVALFDRAECVAADHRVLGRGHAEQLVPMISALPEKGRAERVIVSLGPGSFTGVRIGIATARALGIAWGAQVLGYPTLHLVAAMGGNALSRPLTVCMNGGHGEWFVQNFEADLTAEDAAQSLPPEMAQAACRHEIIAGNRAQELVSLFPAGTKQAEQLLPNAEGTRLILPTILTSNLSPIYGRGPDATLPA